MKKLYALAALVFSASAVFSQTPSLSFRLQEGHVELTWPAAAAAFRLESTVTLGGASEWQPVTATPEALNELLAVRTPASGAARFFRLAQTGTAAVTAMIDFGGLQRLHQKYGIEPGGRVNRISAYTVSGQGVASHSVSIQTGSPGKFTNTAGVAIPIFGAASPYPSTVEVSGFGGVVGRVRVTLAGFGQERADDLDILLVSPTGQKVMLMSDAGGGFLPDITITFDDDAPTSVPDSGPVDFVGSYKPVDYDSGDTLPNPAPAGPYDSALSAFKGKNPNGTWSLYIADDTNDGGFFAGYIFLGWSLEITPLGGEPFPLNLPTGSAYLLEAGLESGGSLWALTPNIMSNTATVISYEMTLEAGLIYGGEQSLAAKSIAALRQNAKSIAEANIDRLFTAVRRIVNNALVKRLDLAPMADFGAERLRAFAGGLAPVRTLESILAAPESEYIPHIYSRRIVHSLLPSNILVSELDSKRWDYRVQGKAGYDGGPHVLSGGTRLVFDSNRDAAELCGLNTLSIYSIALTDPPDAAPRRLTSGALNCFNNQDPAWSWDEQKIAFAAGPSPFSGGTGPRAYQIYVMNHDGSGVTQLTSDTGSERNLRPKWSPDNQRIVYSSNRAGNTDVWIMSSDGSDARNLTAGSTASDGSPAVSPDGRHIAFSSTRDGDSEIFIMNLDGTAVRQLTTNNVINADPAWSHTGLEIVLTRGNADGSLRTLIAINVLSGMLVHDWGNFSSASFYERPVLAATPHVLIPSELALSTGQYTPEGYVTAEGGAIRTSTQVPPVFGAFQIKNQPADPISYYRHEIFRANPNYSRPMIDFSP